MNDKKKCNKVKEVYYKIGVPYSVTVQPDDHHQYYESGVRLKQFRDKMAEVMLANTCCYNFVIELSEPHGSILRHHSGARLHMHGIILFENISELAHYLMYDQARWCKCGRLEVDTITDMDVWIGYMKKQNIIKHRKVRNMSIKDIINKVKCEENSLPYPNKT